MWVEEICLKCTLSNEWNGWHGKSRRLNTSAAPVPTWCPEDLCWRWGRDACWRRGNAPTHAAPPTEHRWTGYFTNLGSNRNRTNFTLSKYFSLVTRFWLYHFVLMKTEILCISHLLKVLRTSIMHSSSTRFSIQSILQKK